jgi:hypothetical protein
MKVLITGHVFGGKGRLEGMVDMDESEAQRLVNLGVAEAVAEEAPADEPAESGEAAAEVPADDTGTTQQAPTKTNKKKSKA